MCVIKNKIKLKGTENYLTYVIKEGKFVKCYFSNQVCLTKTQLSKEKIEIECNKCGSLSCITFYNDLLKRNYICQKCHMSQIVHKPWSEERKKQQSDARKGWYSGKNNPFYGKTHTEETKNKIRETFIENETVVGENNPFYGKTHTEETKNKIREGMKNWWDNMTEEEIVIYSEKTSQGQREFMRQNELYYKKIKSNAARKSHVSQFNNKKMNSIEKIVNDELIKRNIDMHFSVIFCHKQFDFGNKENKILLEVNGDYWHGNENIYGPGLIELNETQKRKIVIDKEKKQIAEKYGFEIFYIWESDIKKGNFSILDKIKEKIK